MKDLRRSLLVLATTALVLAARSAGAQVEVRCPAGFESLPPPGAGGNERFLAACVRPPLQILVRELPIAIAAGTPEETQLGARMLMSMVQSSAPPPVTFRNRPLGAVTARSTSLTTQLPARDGTLTRVEVSMLFLPAGAHTIQVLVIDPSATGPRLDPVLRELAANMVGLGGAPLPWMASASCPPGMTPGEAGEDGGGMHQVIECSEGNDRITVLESHLAMRGPDDARALGVEFQRMLQPRLQPLGITIEVSQPTPLTVGAISGFFVSVRSVAPAAAASNAQPMPHIGAIAGTLATQGGGHVQIVATSSQLDAAGLEQRLRRFATEYLRVDGTPAPGANTNAATAPAPRPRRVIDPNRPLWEPPEVERPRATPTSSSPRRNCGCTAPGRVDARGRVWVLAAALALVARRARRTRR